MHRVYLPCAQLPKYYVLCTSLVLAACVLTHSPTHPLSPVYEDISSHEIKTGTEWDDLGESELMEWLRNGTVTSTSNPDPNLIPDPTPQPHRPYFLIPSSTLALPSPGTVFSKYSFSRLTTSSSHSCRLWIRTDGSRCSLILALTLTLALTPTSTQPLPLPLPYP